MKAAIYIREPMDDINTGYRLMEKAMQNEWKYELFHDRINKRKTRPVKCQLLKKLRSKEFEVVIVDKLGSWANTSTELIRDIAELTDKGITFISVFDKLKFSGGYSDTQNLILRAFNRFEQSKLNEKASLGIKRSKTKRKFPGRPRGSKDKIRRKNGGYLEREAVRRQLRSIS
jgi:DNA invertase Pin-like site-specific DNA recombinase